MHLVFRGAYYAQVGYKEATRETRRIKSTTVTYFPIYLELQLQAAYDRQLRIQAELKSLLIII